MVKVNVLLCVLLFGLSGTAWSKSTIICAVTGKWQPMEYFDEDDKLTGYTVDLLEAAGKIGGFTVAFKRVDAENIVARLHEGEFDAICSSMLNGALRREELDFSTPYYLARQTMVVRAKKVMVASRDWSGMRFGASRGSYGMEAVTGMKRGIPREYSSIAGAMEDVFVRSLDGAVCDEPVARYYTFVKYKDGLKLTGYFANTPKKPLSIAVARGNKTLLKMLNSGISTVKARGIDEELQRKWFIQ